MIRKKRQRKVGQSSVLEHREDPGVIEHWDMPRQSQSEGHLNFVEHTQRGPEQWSQSQRCCPVICLEEMHLCDGVMHCIVYQ